MLNHERDIKKQNFFMSYSNRIKLRTLRMLQYIMFEGTFRSIKYAVMG